MSNRTNEATNGAQRGDERSKLKEDLSTSLEAGEWLDIAYIPRIYGLTLPVSRPFTFRSSGLLIPSENRPLDDSEFVYPSNSISPEGPSSPEMDEAQTVESQTTESQTTEPQVRESERSEAVREQVSREPVWSKDLILSIRKYHIERCIHRRVHGRCKDCRFFGLCAHGDPVSTCDFCCLKYCIHKRRKYSCIDCKTGKCRHGRRSKGDCSRCRKCHQTVFKKLNEKKYGPLSEFERSDRTNDRTKDEMKYEQPDDLEKSEMNETERSDFERFCDMLEA